MKKRLLLPIVALLGFTSAGYAQTAVSSGQDFQYPEGNGVWYTVVDETARTCQTKAGDYDTSSLPYKVVPGNTLSGEVAIPQTVSYGEEQYTVVGIGDYSFSGTFTTMTLPESLTYIGRAAFMGCSQLTGINIPDAVEIIGISAFSNCAALTDVNLPSSLTAIPASLFVYCGNIKQISLPESVVSIGSNAFSNTGITSLSLQNVKSIDNDAFRNCDNLTSVEFSEELTSIPANAFTSCNALTEITLPASITQIGAGAFSYCDLTTVICRNVTPPSMGSSSFSNYTYTNATLYVPNNGITAYERNSLWSSFSDIRPIPVAATGITLDKEYLTIYGGGPSVRLHATVTPADVSEEVVWSVEPEGIATVTDGLVHGIKAGVVNVIATCGSVSAICQTTVLSLKPNSVTVNAPSSDIYVGGKVTLTATVTGGSKEEITWASSNPAVAEIDASTGELTALASGGVVITATCNGVSGSCSLTIYEVAAESITLSPASQTLQVGGSFTITATVNPDNTTNKTVVWTTNDDQVATVTDGIVTATGVGTATITAVCGDATGTCVVTVEATPATSIELSATSITLQVEQSQQLSATVMPENATNKTVYWTSDNTDVASVTADGVVTAVAAGTAKITATCGDLTAICDVTVETPQSDAIVIDMAELILKVGQTQQLTANKTVIWTTGDASVATVSSEGLVEATGVGSTEITASSGNATATCNVTVEATPAEEIILDENTVTLNVDDTYTLTATVMPETTTDKTVNWSSANEETATVEGGVIEGIAPGSTVITAECGGITATCNVTVLLPAKTVTLNYTSLIMEAADVEDLIATVDPENTTDILVWSSSDPNVASVNEFGIVRALTKGTTTITAQCGSASAICEVTVNPIQAESISLDKTQLALTVGDKEQLTATILPEKVTEYNVVWTSSNDNVATVSDDGVVEGISEGNAVITATCDEVNAACSVTVSKSIQTGIGSILPDAEGHYNVFTIDGVNVLKTSHAADLESLPKGIYLVNGLKIKL